MNNISIEGFKERISNPSYVQKILKGFHKNKKFKYLKDKLIYEVNKMALEVSNKPSHQQQMIVRQNVLSRAVEMYVAARIKKEDIIDTAKGFEEFVYNG